MSRGLTANQISYLTSNHYKVEDLIYISKIEDAYDSNDWKYTTGNLSLTASIFPFPAFSQTYTPRSFVAEIGSITESYEPLPTTLTVRFERLSDGGSDDTFIDWLRTGNIINKRVILQRLFRNVSTDVPDTTDGLILWFDGRITGLDITTDLDTQSFELRCSNLFADYDRRYGRTTASIVGALNRQKLVWGSNYIG